MSSPLWCIRLRVKNHSVQREGVLELVNLGGQKNITLDLDVTLGSATYTCTRKTAVCPWGKVTTSLWRYDPSASQVSRYRIKGKAGFQEQRLSHRGERSDHGQRLLRQHLKPSREEQVCISVPVTLHFFQGVHGVCTCWVGEGIWEGGEGKGEELLSLRCCCPHTNIWNWWKEWGHHGRTWCGNVPPWCWKHELSLLQEYVLKWQYFIC